jgi:hypothetical protein
VDGRKKNTPRHRGTAEEEERNLGAEEIQEGEERDETFSV